MRRFALLVTLIALAPAGCQPRTEMMVGVATDIRAPDILDQVQLIATRTKDGFVELQQSWDVTGIPNEPFNLPGSYGVYSPDGTELQVQLELTGLKHGAPVVVRDAILSLVNGKTLFLRMGLTAGCMNVMDCSPTQTCIEGQCRERLVDVRQLPDFVENLVTELTCDSGTHYIDTSTGQPMPFSADAMNCPGSLCSEGTCLKPPPDGGGGGPVDASVPDGSTHIDASAGPDGATSSIVNCPGDVLGTPVKMATTTGVNALLIDPASNSLVWLETQTGDIRLGDPCTPSSSQLIANVPGASGAAIAGGVLWFSAGATLHSVALAPNSTPTFGMDTGVINYLATDGTFLYFFQGTSLIQMMVGQTIGSSLTTASPLNPLIAVGGGFAYWFDTAATNDMSAPGLNMLPLTGTGAVATLVAPISMTFGLFSDGKNVYWTDSAQGLMMQNTGPGKPQQIAPPSTMLNSGGRLTGDGTFLYFTSVSGQPGTDVILQAAPMASATVQTLASNQDVEPGSIFPMLAAGPHGVYWVDSTGTIWRTPAVPALQ